MERDGQLDDPEARAEMSPGYRDCADRFLAEFVRNLLELVGIELAEVGGELSGCQEEAEFGGQTEDWVLSFGTHPLLKRKRGGGRHVRPFSSASRAGPPAGMSFIRLEKAFDD